MRLETVPVKVKVWGEYACFTRPEFKVERVSYPVMTPSAARGVLESIFWKPEFTWRIRAIKVLNEIQYFSIRRNEVSSRMSARNAGMVATDSSVRSQRHTLGLRDVAYVIEADVELRDRSLHNVAKYRDQFRRRVTKGKCFHRPYLGCREFAAHFGDVSADDTPISADQDLGLMLLDVDYGAGERQPEFFNARLEAGVLVVPATMLNRKEAEDATTATGC